MDCESVDENENEDRSISPVIPILSANSKYHITMPSIFEVTNGTASGKDGEKKAEECENTDNVTECGESSNVNVNENVGVNLQNNAGDDGDGDNTPPGHNIKDLPSDMNEEEEHAEKETTSTSLSSEDQAINTGVMQSDWSQKTNVADNVSTAAEVISDILANESVITGDDANLSQPTSSCDETAILTPSDSISILKASQDSSVDFSEKCDVDFLMKGLIPSTPSKGIYPPSRETDVSLLPVSTQQLLEEDKVITLDDNINDTSPDITFLSDTQLISATTVIPEDEPTQEVIVTLQLSPSPMDVDKHIENTSIQDIIPLTPDDETQSVNDDHDVASDDPPLLTINSPIVSEVHVSLERIDECDRCDIIPSDSNKTVYKVNSSNECEDFDIQNSSGKSKTTSKDVKLPSYNIAPFFYAVPEDKDKKRTSKQRKTTQPFHKSPKKLDSKHQKTRSANSSSDIQYVNDSLSMSTISPNGSGGVSKECRVILSAEEKLPADIALKEGNVHYTSTPVESAACDNNDDIKVVQVEVDQVTELFKVKVQDMKIVHVDHFLVTHSGLVTEQLLKDSSVTCTEMSRKGQLNFIFESKNNQVSYLDTDITNQKSCSDKVKTFVPAQGFVHYIKDMILFVKPDCCALWKTFVKSGKKVTEESFFTEEVNETKYSALPTIVWQETDKDITARVEKLMSDDSLNDGSKEYLGKQFMDTWKFYFKSGQLLKVERHMIPKSDLHMLFPVNSLSPEYLADISSSASSGISSSYNSGSSQKSSLFHHSSISKIYLPPNSRLKGLKSNLSTSSSETSNKISAFTAPGPVKKRSLFSSTITSSTSLSSRVFSPNEIKMDRKHENLSSSTTQSDSKHLHQKVDEAHSTKKVIESSFPERSDLQQPYSSADLQNYTIYGSSNESGDVNVIKVGSRIMARYSDGIYYLAKVLDKKDNNYDIVFDEDKVKLTLHEYDIINIHKLPIGLNVSVKSKKLISHGLIINYCGRDDDYIVAKCDHDTCRFIKVDVFLNGEQAKELEVNLYGRCRAPIHDVSSPISANLDLGNLVYGKRKSSSLKAESSETPKSSRKKQKCPDVNLYSTASSDKVSTDSDRPSQSKRRKNTKSQKMLFPCESAAISASVCNNKSLLAGMAFMLSAAYETCDEKDSNTMYDLEDNTYFDKKCIRGQIELCGGKVLADFSELKSVKKKYRVFLIASTYLRTVKYLQCLASGIPCLSYNYVTDCCVKNRILNVRNYYLPAGYSSVSHEVIMWHGKTDILRGKKLMVMGDKEFQNVWTDIVMAAGAKFVRRPVGIKNLRNSLSDIDVVICQNNCPKKVMDICKKCDKEIHVLSSEWLVQTVISGEVLPFDADKKFIIN